MTGITKKSVIELSEQFNRGSFRAEQLTSREYKLVVVFVGDQPQENRKEKGNSP